MHGVYAIRNQRTGMWYVGSSSDVETRLYSHRYSLRKGNHDTPRLQNAWNKYGEEAFVFEVIEICPAGEELKREQMYLDSFFTSNVLYDENPIAGKPPSQKGRRLSSYGRKNTYWKGRKREPFSEEHRQRMREAWVRRKSRQQGEVT